MADTAAPVLKKITVEGDVQVAYFTIASVANTNTTDFSRYSKNIFHVQATGSSTAAVGATVSAGVVTWAISAATPNLLVRLAFD